MLNFSMRSCAAIIAVAMLALSGCSEKEDEHAGHDHGDGDHDHSQRAKAVDPLMTPSPELAEFVTASSDPTTTAIPAGTARAEAQTGQAIAVTGRIKDFIPGTTAFTLVDSKIPACSDIPGDACETPWDYCCEPKENLIPNMITIQMVSADGKARSGNLKGVGSLDNLTTVVVTGTADKDLSGNVTVKAETILVQN